MIIVYTLLVALSVSFISVVKNMIKEPRISEEYVRLESNFF